VINNALILFGAIFTFFAGWLAVIGDEAAIAFTIIASVCFWLSSDMDE
jgi:hypothetical protein